MVHQGFDMWTDPLPFAQPQVLGKPPDTPLAIPKGLGVTGCLRALEPKHVNSTTAEDIGYTVILVNNR